MDQFSEELKKVVQAGLGAVATGVEKAQEAVESFTKKGEPLYQQAKSAVTDAADKLKQAFDKSGIADVLCGKPRVAEVIDALRDMDAEDRALVREALDLLDAQPQDDPADPENQAEDDDPPTPGDGGDTLA